MNRARETSSLYDKLASANQLFYESLFFPLVSACMGFSFDSITENLQRRFFFFAALLRDAVLLLISPELGVVTELVFRGN